jgi:phage shock protein PspC (stress-responsive transcriptional regulator)/signal transduction histidine kinase
MDPSAVPGPFWERRRAFHQRRPGRGPVVRRSEGRMLGGIAAAISSRIGLDITLVRVGLVLFGLLSGIGLAAYVIGWLLLPCDDGSGVIGPRALTDKRGIAIAIALVPVLVLLVIGVGDLHAGVFGSLASPGSIAVLGLVFIWRDGTDADRTALRRLVAPLAQLGPDSIRSWRWLWARIGIGLVLAALAFLALNAGRPGAWLEPLGGVALVLAAIVVVFGPWWLTLGRDLVVERQARLRAEERAEMASRVHDSVLQTLAMIQRNADQPQRVAQLARAQERELRSWLFDGRVPGSFGPAGDGAEPAEPVTLAAAVRQIQEEVEATHGIKVETVVVGDCPVNADIDALLSAGREATVNAAKWSGADSVAIFAEVGADTVQLFVRDRGRGFDPDTVPSDRKGVAQSVRGRIERHGGTAVVRTAPGEGTEWELTMNRKAGSTA